MRDRHVARLCRCCRAPMARQEDACWRCGAQSVSEDVPRTTLRVIAGGAPARAFADPARAEARVQIDRWTDDGGSGGWEPARVAAGR